ncbi:MULTISPECIES: tetratricopeptide repeat protein [unclassified Lysobacter]|uniref:tetratricopeptide repeat protein n=1 Tax=unclassified Lysobacter TaxID=2635362 RepID=UPI0012DD4F26|nr:MULTISPECIES: tetratricopeptide repeat protein [unclassified Lysobacter]
MDRAEERRQRHGEKKEDKKASAAASKVEYPNATRQQPDAKASAKVTPKLKKMMDLYDADKGSEARAIADEIIANSAANAYDHAFAAQIAAQLAYDADDTAAAIGYLNKALEFNGLDNNGHYSSMFMLAQLQLQEDKYAESLATMDRFLSETKSTKPEHLIVKGNALYRLERYADASKIIKQAIDASPEPKSDWQQLLMASYAESGQTGEATKMAEAVASKNPTDKRAQLNLVATYLQADQYDKAAAVLEKLRAGGQLNEDKDYRQLYSTYLQIDGNEKKAADVINEGLTKGILKPDFQAYLALAQSYYFSDQVNPSIEAYKKAAPLAPDGETYLNLARVLWQEDRIPEAKEAAKQAIAKGVKKPDDAKKIIALPGK